MCATFAPLSWPCKEDCSAVHLATPRQGTTLRGATHTNRLRTGKIKRRRESVSRSCQGQKRVRHQAGVSVPKSSDRDSPGCQLTLERDIGWFLQTFSTIPTLHLFDVLMIWIDHSLGVEHPHLSALRLHETHLLEKARTLLPELGNVSK